MQTTDYDSKCVQMTNGIENSLQIETKSPKTPAVEIFVYRKILDTSDYDEGKGARSFHYDKWYWQLRTTAHNF